MDKFGRPSWDAYFMAQAFVTSQRSLDPSTKHGCVIVSKDKKILSMGYNGPPSGALDEIVPLERPAKYAVFAHAEANAIDNCYANIEGATAYVTGTPCSACLLRLVQRKVSKIVHGTVGSNMVNDEDAAKSASILGIMPDDRKPEIVVYDCNKHASVLIDTLEYMAHKCGSVSLTGILTLPSCGCNQKGLIRRLWRKIF